MQKKIKTLGILTLGVLKPGVTKVNDNVMFTVVESGRYKDI